MTMAKVHEALTMRQSAERRREVRAAEDLKERSAAAVIAGERAVERGLAHRQPLITISTEQFLELATQLRFLAYTSNAHARLLLRQFEAAA